MRIILFVLCLLPAVSATAHEDIDLGVTQAGYDDQCRAVVTLQNTGRALPDFFYNTLGPFVEVFAGKKRLELHELYDLDEGEQLKSVGGQLTFTAGRGGVPLDGALKVEIRIRGHWIDYNEKNNTLTKTVGCEPGKGEIAGTAEKPRFADLKTASVDIDKKTCLATVTIENVNGVSLPKTAWNRDNGVTLISIDAGTREHRPDVPMSALDAGEKLAHGEKKIIWRDKNPVTGMDKIIFGIWRVPNDPDFENNNLEVDVPAECRLNSKKSTSSAESVDYQTLISHAKARREKLTIKNTKGKINCINYDKNRH